MWAWDGAPDPTPEALRARGKVHPNDGDSLEDLNRVCVMKQNAADDQCPSRCNFGLNQCHDDAMAQRVRHLGNFARHERDIGCKEQQN